MLKIGVQTGGLKEWYPLREVYRMIAEAGFDAVDAGINALWSSKQIKEHFVPDVLLGDEKAFLEALIPFRDGAAQHGLFHSQAHAPYPFYAKYNNDPETDRLVLDRLQWFIRGCDFIGCRNLVVHPAFHGYRDPLSPEEEWKINIEAYTSLIPAAKEYGVTVCLENMLQSRINYKCPKKSYQAICSDASEAISYIDELNRIAGEKIFAFCYDIGHANLVSRDIRRESRLLGERIKVLHIHDNDGISDQHLPPYMGTADWDRFVLAMRDIGFGGTLSFETGGVWMRWDPELAPQVFKLIAETGRMFARRIEAP